MSEIVTEGTGEQPEPGRPVEAAEPTEQHPEQPAEQHPEQGPEPALPTYPVTEPVTEPAPARRTPFALKATAAVAAAALVGVGIGVGIIQVKYSDDTAAPVAAAPSAAPSASPKAPAYGAQANGTHFGSLRDLLLPVPAGYQLGPDDGQYGNDTELTQDQLNSDLDAGTSDLPKDQRDKVKGAFKAEGHKGAGVRSYRSSDAKTVVTIWLDQFNQKSVAVQSAVEGALGSGLFRQGPEVPGYQDARCFLPPAKPSEPIDELMCTAAVGDLLVSMHVEGVAPLPKGAAVSIFRQQLERLALPGASV